MSKPLNIGMIGYGFMGRAHSNGYRKVNNFFDLEHRPVTAQRLHVGIAAREQEVREEAQGNALDRRMRSSHAGENIG